MPSTLQFRGTPSSSQTEVDITASTSDKLSPPRSKLARRLLEKAYPTPGGTPGPQRFIGIRSQSSCELLCSGSHNTTNDSSARATGKGLKKSILQSRFLLLLTSFKPVLEAVNLVSKALQTVQIDVASAMEKIECLKA